MPHRLRKVRKLRGSRTHGWGRTGQHRGSGSRGGKGKAGLDKHKKSWMIKNRPDYFGKHGFKRPWVSEPETMNVGELDEIIDDLLVPGVADKNENGIVIDLSDLRVEKLLGSGKISHPLIVKADSWSKTAARKIESAGGRIFNTQE